MKRNIIKEARIQCKMKRREVANIIHVPLMKYLIYEHDYGKVELFDAITLSELLHFKL